MKPIQRIAFHVERSAQFLDIIVKCIMNYLVILKFLKCNGCTRTPSKNVPKGLFNWTTLVPTQDFRNFFCLLRESGQHAILNTKFHSMISQIQNMKQYFLIF